MKPCRVLFAKAAEKDARRCPNHIKEALRVWTGLVELKGLAEVRKLPGYHDEPLHGRRKGQRSVRLNRLWRAIYVELEDMNAILVQVEEVTPHAY